MQITVAAQTHPGLARELNEDSVFAQSINTTDGTPLALLVVCDGMGGHLGGEVASRWAIETIQAELRDLLGMADPRGTVRLSEQEIAAAVDPNRPHPTTLLPASDISNRISAAVQKANQVVFRIAQEKPETAGNCGTTMTMAFVQGDTLLVANVGDSRTSLVRDGKLVQISRDHSLVAGLVESGQIKEEDVYTHPQRNIIYRSLGQKDDVKVDLFQEVLQPGDFLLLCSDGLWEMVHESRRLVKILEKARNLEDACQDLIEAANAAGGEDNIGVVIARLI